MPRAAQVEGVEQLGRVDAADGVACGEMNGQWIESCVVRPPQIKSCPLSVKALATEL